MTDGMLAALAFSATLGSGLIAGVFYAFSTFVMKALARLPAGAGMAAMQAINVVVLNPFFLSVFLGTALLGVAAMVVAVTRWGRPGAAYLLAGGASYVVGTFLVTVACNVPLNNALAKVLPIHSDAADRWNAYVRRWTAWNHVRAAAALVACGMFAMAFARLSRP